MSFIDLQALGARKDLITQLRKLMPREPKWFAQHHTARAVKAPKLVHSTPQKVGSTPLICPEPRPAFPCTPLFQRGPRSYAGGCEAFAFRR